MTQNEVKRLHHGLYKLYWKQGKSSFVAVGSDEAGNRWFMPTNWISETVCKDWTMVRRVAAIIAPTL